MAGRIRLISIAVLALVAFTLPTAAQIVGNGSRKSTEAQAFFDKGQTYINAGQYKKAVEAYKQGSDSTPTMRTHMPV